ncbi:hypothetical protein N7495_003247 [Penicillium taxi]|uniref:uncharacterized protein n=1 Tax=Penicillium taxi TaxID=168475 RepID=UPI0025454DA0|nr:uncharacterized protein N7495_003247 [Penicillium taxi]KAJ5902719.1 hypothetical protein N7495_003247 [Penicillium taxi]
MESSSPCVTVPTWTKPGYDQRVIDELIELFQSKVSPALGDVTESELDCLNLFIVRPSKDALVKRGYDTNIPLPVFAWIHGGAFGFGAGTDPMWVLEALNLGKPFIAVFLNYRVGIFGFGATSAMIETQTDEKIKGVNFGLRDQKVGLQWISNNISAFGGDPQRVTIGGQSAGGNSIHLHALEAKTNQSLPLFQKAIVQSGAMGTCGPILLANAQVQWDGLCKVLGISTDNKNAALNAMEKFTAAELIQGTREIFWLLFPLVNDQLTLDFSVKLDPILVNLGDTSSVQDVSQSGSSIEILLGEVDNEATIWQHVVETLTSFDTIQERFSSSTVDPQIVEKTLGHYRLSPEASLEDIKSGIYRLISEFQFSLPLYKAWKSFAGADFKLKSFYETTARRYKVNFGNPFSNGPKKHLYGMSHHCVDLIYIFNAFPSEMNHADTLLKPSEVTNDLLRQRMQSDWIDFIVSDGGQSFNPDTVVRYDKDRVTRVVKASEDDFFIQQLARLSFLGEHLTEIDSLVNAFTGKGTY